MCDTYRSFNVDGSSNGGYSHNATVIMYISSPFIRKNYLTVMSLEYSFSRSTLSPRICGFFTTNFTAPNVTENLKGIESRPNSRKTHFQPLISQYWTPIFCDISARKPLFSQIFISGGSFVSNLKGSFNNIISTALHQVSSLLPELSNPPLKSILKGLFH